MLTEERRRERREEQASDLELKRDLEHVAGGEYRRDVDTRAARLLVEPPFWGTRYQVDRVPRARGGVRWDIVDTAGPVTARRVIEGDNLKSRAVHRADQFNHDPSANYNGARFPKVHSAGNIWHPAELCDCQDGPEPYPKPNGWKPENACGERIGTYCLTHGAHDDCPRAVRGIGLASDLARLALERFNLEMQRKEHEFSLEFIESEYERLDRVERAAERVGV